jgi:phage shock protein A
MPAEVDVASKALEAISILGQKIGKIEDELERLVKARECADEAAKNLENELRNSLRNREELMGKAYDNLRVGLLELATSGGRYSTAKHSLETALEILKPYGKSS